ncbi:MAG: hypothetical protein BGP24_16880 [Lysobacterales bacterium 69-70]|nr:hypothetical protein [Xanthomonadaceae bacterium]ODU33560.1 MAG: hypothetical protein ABS97_11250 [Xanthomonadaceae bacterium SCN 69-320]ODV21996.1 MAG: hypothetical protein ABT27_03625 [Xanthomonadaceae bacterium SCN 69-25]OJZ02899.1 MAG: hypothetical protein BGP24_16880 [Xanthomonadales bacterium 69-70]
MKRILLALFATFGLAFAAYAAKDVKDGNAYVKAVQKDQFLFQGNPLGKNMLLGSLQELKDEGQLTGVVLRNAGDASPEHRHLIKVIADYLQIKAYDKDLQPLAD